MRANRAVLLVDGVKVMDKTVANTAAGALVLKVGEVGTYFSGIKLYNVKARIWTRLPIMIFQPYIPAALPGVDWTYDTADGINGLKTAKAWRLGVLPRPLKTRRCRRLQKQRNLRWK